MLFKMIAMCMYSKSHDANFNKSVSRHRLVSLRLESEYDGTRSEERRSGTAFRLFAKRNGTGQLKMNGTSNGTAFRLLEERENGKIFQEILGEIEQKLPFIIQNKAKLSVKCEKTQHFEVIAWFDRSCRSISLS